MKRDAVIGFPSIERLLRQQLGNVSNRALAGSALPRMLLFSLVVGSFGCSVVPSKGSWGGNWPPFTDIGSAAADAAKDPQTLSASGRSRRFVSNGSLAVIRVVERIDENGQERLFNP